MKNKMPDFLLGYILAQNRTKTTNRYGLRYIVTFDTQELAQALVAITKKRLYKRSNGTYLTRVPSKFITAPKKFSLQFIDGMITAQATLSKKHQLRYSGKTAYLFKQALEQYLPEVPYPVKLGSSYRLTLGTKSTQYLERLINDNL